MMNSGKPISEVGLEYWASNN